eukprot:1576047-Prorocentrum_lima.AAC.1
MMLRCVACFSKGVLVVTGVLTQLKQQGKCADEIVERVHEALRHFCTRRRPTPGIDELKCRP